MTKDYEGLVRPGSELWQKLNKIANKLDADYTLDSIYLRTEELSVRVEELEEAIRQLIDEAITARLDLGVLIPDETGKTKTILEDDVKRLDATIKTAKQALIGDDSRS